VVGAALLAVIGKTYAESDKKILAKGLEFAFDMATPSDEPKMPEEMLASLVDFLSSELEEFHAEILQPLYATQSTHKNDSSSGVGPTPQLPALSQQKTSDKKFLN